MWHIYPGGNALEGKVASKSRAQVIGLTGKVTPKSRVDKTYK